MRAPPSLLLSALILTPLACGDDGGGTDASPDSTTPPDSTVMPTDLTSLTPCPPGWQEVGGGDAPIACEPWPSGGHDECDASSAHFPGEAGCVAIGTACPAGDFEEGLADDGSVIFVMAGATGGDGTRGSPLGSAADALMMATAGTTVALAKGTHDGAVVVPDGVTLRGACPAETVIVDTAASTTELVVLSGAGPAIENVALEVGDATGIYGEWMGQDARVTDVVIRGDGPGGNSTGIEHGGLSLTVRSVRISDLDAGIVFVLDTDSMAFDLERVSIENVLDGAYGFGYEEGASFALRDAAIRDAAQSTLSFSLDLGTATVERVILERATFVGVYAQFGGRYTLSDLVIRDMQSDPMGLDGAGLAFDFIGTGGSSPNVTLRRVLVDRARDAGIWSAGSRVDAVGLVVREVQRQTCTDCPAVAGAAGFAVDQDSVVTIDDFFIADVDGCGIHVGESGELDLSHGYVRRATVGACIRAEGFDVERLTTDVEYDDNMSSLDSTGLPVPTIDGTGPGG